MDKIKKLPLRDFTRYCMSIAAVPSSYLSGLTLEEQLLWLCSFLTNEVIPTVNNNGEAVEELQALYVELKNYVDNYFDNLDIQEEVNTKLEEMAQSGELAELIAQYLEAQAVIGFNTCSSLAGATNLANGSFARTLGRNTYSDGYGAFYKIRTRINADVPDGYNIITLSNTENLVAERIVSQVEKDTNVLKRSLIENKKIIFIGDSYQEGWTPDGNTTSFVTQIATYLGLSSSQYIDKHYGGTGFAATVDDNKNFITLLSEIPADDSVTDIIVAAGYNDRIAINGIQQGIHNFCELARTNFPNAKIHIGQIGRSNIGSDLYPLSRVTAAYIRYSYENNVHYLNNVEYSLHVTNLMASDGYHPNQEGQNELARNIKEAFINGSCQVARSYDNITIKNKNSAISTESLSGGIACTQLNGLINVTTQAGSDIVFSTNQSFSNRAGFDIRLFDVDKSMVLGSNYTLTDGKVQLILQASDTKVYNAIGSIAFVNGEVHLIVRGLANINNQGYQSITVSAIQIQGPMNFCCNALLC